MDLFKNVPGNISLIKDVFKKFVNYSKNLSFQQNPDYNFIKSMF